MSCPRDNLDILLVLLAFGLTPGSCSKRSQLDFTFLGQYLPAVRFYWYLICEII